MNIKVRNIKLNNIPTTPVPGMNWCSLVFSKRPKGI